MTAPAHHFATLEQQADAARLGTLVFLGSEALLFAGLFTLWAAYRAEWTSAFHAAARETNGALGLADTALLLAASFSAAMGVHAFRAGHRRQTVALLCGAAGLAVVFLALKITEWIEHLHHGFAPAGNAGRGAQLFWTLYYATTGLHALHATIGIVVLLTLATMVGRGRLEPDRGYVVENGVSYWHLVDALWLLIWPMFYLMRGGG